MYCKAICVFFLLESLSLTTGANSFTFQMIQRRQARIASVRRCCYKRLCYGRVTARRACQQKFCNLHIIPFKNQSPGPIVWHYLQTDGETDGQTRRRHVPRLAQRRVVKIDHRPIALPTKYNYQATSVGCQQIARHTEKCRFLQHISTIMLKLHLFDLLSICYTSKYATNTVKNRTDGA